MILLAFHARSSLLRCHRIRDEPIAVGGVVVVRAPVRVDIPEIRGIRDIGRPRPPIVGSD